MTIANASPTHTGFPTVSDRRTILALMSHSVVAVAFARPVGPKAPLPALPRWPPCHPSLIGFYAHFPDNPRPDPIISPGPAGATGKATREEWMKDAQKGLIHPSSFILHPSSFILHPFF